MQSENKTGDKTDKIVKDRKKPQLKIQHHALKISEVRIRVVVDEVVTIKKQRNKYIGQQNLNRMNEGRARLYVYE